MHEHHSFFDSVFVHSFMVISFVFASMLVIEFLNYYSLGTWKSKVFKSKLSEYVFSILLGLSPGCLGAFFVVTLYSHGVVGFGALTAVMIATSGDESFIMLSLIPKHYLYLNIILFVVSFFTALIVDKFFKNFNKTTCALPTDDACKLFFSRKFTRPKTYFILSYAATIVLLALLVEHKLEAYIVLAANITTLILLCFTHTHFIIDHIYKHLIKKHLFKLALWTLGSFMLVNLLIHQLHIEDLIKNNNHLIMFIAGLVGLIPESGPHIIFTQLFAQSLIPFSILVCNSISQDGHAGIPLLAESKKSFIYVKILNLFVAYLVGFFMLLLAY